MPSLADIRRRDPDNWLRVKKLLTDLADRAPLDKAELEEPGLSPERRKMYAAGDPNHRVMHEMMRVGAGNNRIAIIHAYNDRVKGVDLPMELVPSKGQTRVLQVDGTEVTEHRHLAPWLRAEPSSAQVVIRHDSIEIHHPGYYGRIHKDDPRTLVAGIGKSTVSHYPRIETHFRFKNNPDKMPKLPRGERSLVREDLGLGPAQWLLRGRSVNANIKRPDRLKLIRYVRDEIRRGGKPGQLARALGKGSGAQLLIATYLESAGESEVRKEHPIVREVLAPALANHPAKRIIKAHNHAGLEGVRIFAAIPERGAASRYYRAYRNAMAKVPPSKQAKLADALIKAHGEGKPPKQCVEDFLAGR